MILLIDNYDSFSYNLYQLIGSINPDIKVVRNDQMTIDEIKAGAYHFITGSRISKGRRHLHRSGKGTGKRDSHLWRLPWSSGHL